MLSNLPENGQSTTKKVHFYSNSLHTVTEDIRTLSFFIHFFFHNLIISLLECPILVPPTGLARKSNACAALRIPFVVFRKILKSGVWRLNKNSRYFTCFMFLAIPLVANRLLLFLLLFRSNSTKRLKLRSILLLLKLKNPLSRVSKICGPTFTTKVLNHLP